jgi:hypothetical protein
MASHDDGPLALSRRQFGRAVAALAEPLPIWDGGAARLVPPVYSRLRGALRGATAQFGRRMPSSRPPCHTRVLSLLVDIDQAAAEWEPDEPDTLARLRAAAERDRRPQDCSLLDGYTARVEGWTLEAVEVLGDKPPEVALRLPCPRCDKRFVYRLSAGENVRSAALRVSEAGARCLACRASWEPAKLEFLAKLLGLPALPS